MTLYGPCATQTPIALVSCFFLPFKDIVTENLSPACPKQSPFPPNSVAVPRGRLLSLSVSSVPQVIMMWLLPVGT